MNRVFSLTSIRLAAMALAMLLGTAVQAAPVTRSTPRQAHAFFSEAVKYFEANGPEKSFVAFSQRNGKFVKKDLYVFVIDQQGVYRANGAAPDALVGLNVLDARDAAGTPLFRNMLEAVKSEPEGSVNYVWLDRATNKVEPKTTYLHRFGDYVLGVGYYSPHSSESDAKHLLEQAVQLAHDKGIAKAAKAFNDGKGKFVHDDLYVFAVNLASGKFEAHGRNPKWTGTQASDLHDVEGHALIDDMIKLALKDGAGSVDYVWRNPITNAVEKKRTFIRREGNSLIGVGYYLGD
jgi:cytochrome c